MMRRRVAAVLVGAAVAATTGIVPAQATSTTAPPKSTTPRSTSTVIADVERFVARTRGLAFKRPVPVTLLTGKRFRDRLLADAEEDRAQTDVAERELRALGLLDRGVHLFDVLQGFIGDAVIGFYDPRQGDLVVRSAALTPYARVTLAHELTHALDDQWFGLDRPALEKPGAEEAGAAFQALVEGNAVRVQEVYRATLSRAERRSAEREELLVGGSVDYSKVPPVVPQLIGFPYVAGPAFVQALLGAGGERRVDAAFRRPPTTTEQIVRPSVYLAGRPPIAVAQPAAEGKVIDHGVFGHSTLLLVLQAVVGTQAATTAANGWGGDSFVAWDTAGKTCLRARFAMDSRRDLDELTAALRTFAKVRKATIDRRSTTVAFTSCA